ncbi:MBL fold metallo-hydrolase [Candidatus Viadribacter manganicus]|uniref:Glyoxalase n=1 Tax=Candidatus Viadribacter manganicus TaxID=1759059 RepID=A0A1B1AK30_9PROT|nr:MBL fold metallo-hydrolase [Candidatus Viadribacter manganicus]ANP46917.1 glyoxalase [Candidatus Viadribacter manganicus]
MSEPQLQIRVIPVTPLQQNCSLIWNEATKNAALVDPGGDIDRLLGVLEQFGLELTRIWLTHGHFDHAGAAAELRERTGVSVEGPHRDDQFWLDLIEESAQRYSVSGLRNVTPDRYFEDGETLEFEGVRFDISHTPGHTPGHVVIHNTELKIAFVGDVLFAGSIGRTDFPRGNHEQLIHSITSKLWPLGDEIAFVPGHGPTSTFARERQSNPFVADRITGYAGATTHAPDIGEQRASKRWS